MFKLEGSTEILLFQQTKQTKALTGGHASKDRFKEREYSNGGARYFANDWSPSLDDEVLPRQGKPTTIAVDEVSHRKRKRKSDFPRISLTHRSNLIDHLGVSEVPLAPREKNLPRRVRSLTPEDFQHVDRGGILGSQRKRLRVNVEEYSEWKDIQDLLQPAPGVVPTVVTIDGNDFEEYEVIACDLLLKRIILSASKATKNGLSFMSDEKSLHFSTILNTKFVLQEPPVLGKRPCYSPMYG